MHVAALALKLRHLSSWIEQQEACTTLKAQQLPPVPFGRAEVTIDATSTAPAASLNRNRIHLCGDGNGLTLSGLQEIVALFEARKIERCFAWLSPGPNSDVVREWLDSLGFARVTWTRYPTLLHAATPTLLPQTDLEIRQVNAAEIAQTRPLLGAAMMDGYFATAGKRGFLHYMAFDESQPIAVAALVEVERIGYLTYAVTNASARRRGAQTALILRRIEDARRLGCTQIVSQTLTMLRESFANLQRCGFREVYEQEVYERNTPRDAAKA
jgi:N-acetylglutamate synthase-like GNAT family acetyltransferase